MIIPLMVSVAILALVINPTGPYYAIVAQTEPENEKQRQNDVPAIDDPKLTVDKIYSGLNGISNMAFIDKNDILVLDRDEGNVKRIINGTMLQTSLLQLDVDRNGLLGIAVASKENGRPSVFLYLTENLTKSFDNTSASTERDLTNPVANRLYRYDLSSNNSLVNAKLLLDLPAIPRSQHDGGELLIGPDKNLYLVIGDIGGRGDDNDTKGKAQNYGDGPDADGSSGILRITQDGKPVGKGILGDEYPLNLYYAYGIRNSFGMDFDPLTGNLWDTENGPEYGDEINLVEPGFNSGFDALVGQSAESFNPDGLVDFGGNGRYSDPEFSWGTRENKFSVAPTSIEFFNSNKLGSEYINDVFVADINNGYIYHFTLDSNRTGLQLDKPIDDKVAENKNELDDIVFGRGFGGISDLQIGPDGNLYVLSGKDGGTIFRIREANNAS